MENNIITNKQAERIGIKRHILASLAQKGELERAKNGVYKKKDAIDDDFAAISLNLIMSKWSFLSYSFVSSWIQRQNT